MFFSPTCWFYPVTLHPKHTLNFLYCWRLHLISSLLLFFHYFLITFLGGCAGSLLLHSGFLQVQQAEAAVPRGAWASHCSGLSCCEAQAPGTGASVVEAHRPQSAWASVTVARGLTSLQHVESFQTRHWTHVPCTGRWILIHCHTREVLQFTFKTWCLGKTLYVLSQYI